MEGPYNKDRGYSLVAKDFPAFLAYLEGQGDFVTG